MHPCFDAIPLVKQCSKVYKGSLTSFDSVQVMQYNSMYVLQYRYLGSSVLFLLIRITEKLVIAARGEYRRAVEQQLILGTHSANYNVIRPLMN